MKVLLPLLVLLLTLGCDRKLPERNVSGIEWRKEYHSALRESEKRGRPVFLYFSALWCSWCREYEKELSRVAPYISGNFIPLLLDSDRDRDLFLSFGGRGTPFTVVLSPRGRVLLSFHGSVRAEDLKDILSLSPSGKCPAHGEEGGLHPK
ncbi:thioredoxin family protein [Hydrogenivirga sp. 128-5-R1-1]|uniref:thioredoxin family protein n=1 Tax=Hydrogenivirga sp. 128-5-R1-1 TaxID=392423 RepID=UPI00015F179F|nr:thioredoxin family protein [Hydrogenivirga sp. 128-5-R1-1]EDP76048.1 hypothetical protein HG1285_17799 [Hydrogenivirga sp. 128-5-R1-1]